MGQGILTLDQIREPLWCDKCTRNLAILSYAWHIWCCVANIGGLACSNMWLLMSRVVKFVTWSSLAFTPCFLSYNPYLSWDWTTVGRWILPDHWLSRHIEQSTYWWWWSIIASGLSLLLNPKSLESWPHPPFWIMCWHILEHRLRYWRTKG